MEPEKYASLIEPDFSRGKSEEEELASSVLPSGLTSVQEARLPYLTALLSFHRLPSRSLFPLRQFTPRSIASHGTLSDPIRSQPAQSHLVVSCLTQEALIRRGNLELQTNKKVSRDTLALLKVVSHDAY